MTAKEYLGQLRIIRANIRILNEQVQYLETRLTSITVAASKEKVQSSGSGDAFESRIADLVDKKNECLELEKIYDALRQRIILRIVNLGNETYTKILQERYIKEKSMLQIATELNYSYDWIRHLHRDALAAFENIYLKSE